MNEMDYDDGTEFYKNNGIEVTTISDANSNDHYFVLIFPNGDILKYDILLVHYETNGYINFRKNILRDVKLRLRKTKLNRINEKLKIIKVI